MSIWFAEYKAGDKSVVEKFFTPEALWKWLQEYRDKTGGWPHNLCVYKGECIFDGG